MGETLIQWTATELANGAMAPGFTFNPWIGCSKKSPGCTFCYAEVGPAAKFQGVEWGPGKPRKRTSVSNWQLPYRWNRAAIKLGARLKVFCASLADWLDDEVPIEWLADLFEVIANTPQLDWMMLTKRPENWRGRLDEAWRHHALKNPGQTVRTPGFRLIESWIVHEIAPPNVWLGTTVEDQKRADERIPILVRTPARIRFLSVEPLLEAVNIDKWLKPYSCTGCSFHGSESDHGPVMCDDCQVEAVYSEEHGSDRCPKCEKVEGSDSGIGYSCPNCGLADHWSEDNGFLFDRGAEDGPAIKMVIVGGESGHQARPFNVDWARDFVRQCQDAEIAVFIKQLGARPFVDLNKGGRWLANSGDSIDTALRLWPKLRDNHGGDMTEWPEDLRVRQWPK